MPRYKLLIEYDGTPFVGWQRQAKGISIQQSIEEAIEKFCQEKTPLTGAGRTDAGVHARGQVAHFDVSRELDIEKMADAINFYLRPKPIAILHAEKTNDDFHARFSARERSYVYRIVNRRTHLTIDANRAWHVIGDLDWEKMHQAAQHLVGTHDFTSFRHSECQAKSPVRTVHEIKVYCHPERSEGSDSKEILRSLTLPQDDIFIYISAKSFLHHMVRNITGSLVMVGSGKWSVEDFIRARDERERAQGGPTAPPDGLYFLSVLY